MEQIGKATHSLHFVDVIVFILVLCFSVGIGTLKSAIFSLNIFLSLITFYHLNAGLYHAFTGGKQKTLSEYYTGNRKLRTLPVALSILVSFVSAILVLGTPAEMYTR